MEKRFVTFLVIAFAILIGNAFLMNWLNPPKPKPKPLAQQAANPDQADEKSPAEPAVADAAAKAPVEAPVDADAAEPAAAEPESPAENADQPAAEAALPETRVTLGSADPKSPYKMLVTLLNRGAAVERIELNSLNEQDQEDHTGYLGHVDAIDAPSGAGALLGIVGPGTPSAQAGLATGDIITAIGNTQIDTAQALERAMIKTRPHETIEVHYRRDGKDGTAQVALTRRPMEVIRPDDLEELIKHWERITPHIVRPNALNVPSFLLTLDQLDDRKLGEKGGELPGVKLEHTTWEVVPGANESKVEFKKTLVGSGLEIIKRYELTKAGTGPKDKPGYALNLTVEIRNPSDKVHNVRYRLYGPNGLPTEGWWYASKISRNWGGAGPRDLVLGLEEGGRVVPSMIGTAKIVSDDGHEPRRGTPLSYIGVDAQYFSAVMMPQKEQLLDDWFYEWQPVVIGPVPKQSDKQRLANVSFRLTSKTVELPSGGANPLKHTYTIFVGPKKPSLVEQYGLSGIVYYGWPVFAAVARPMAGLLHLFYGIVHNYGIAIILLTVLVRSCMMPLSRKQAMAAQTMQELQPELKKLQEKHKTNMEARSKAQKELFQKYNYNPMGGCLLMFVQLPIFIGLYRALSVDIELRQAPLLWEGAWASNLAAPDMLYRWAEIMPSFFLGWLGPYFNLLPVITIVLFIVQQKMFMPPATDEQTAMQQKMMQYMMIFIGVMFFKVPSGLCIYFISSSLWGLAERKLIPKPGAKQPEVLFGKQAKLPPSPGGNGNGNGSSKGSDKNRQREKR